MMKSTDAFCLHWRQQERGLTHFFLGRQSSTTSPFGDVFFQSLVFDISSGLNVWDEDARCEEEIRHQLLTTLLPWATHYAYIIEIPSTSKERANSGVNSNSSHPHRRGRAWEDANLQWIMPSQDTSTATHCTKSRLWHKWSLCKVRSLNLLYISTLVNGEHLKGKATVGVLLDKDSVQFVFSTLCLLARWPDDQMTAHPIVMVSPLLK